MWKGEENTLLLCTLSFKALELWTASDACRQFFGASTQPRLLNKQAELGPL